MRFPLKSPIVFDGKSVTELNLDLDALTADDLDAAEGQTRRALMAQGEALFVPETDSRYIREVAAKAAHVPTELIGRLKPADYTRLKNEVRAFLLAESASPDETATIADQSLPATSAS